MNHWLRRLLLVLSVGGGFTGVVITAIPLFSPSSLTISTALFCLIFIALYSYGVFAGLSFAERAETRHLLRFLWLQVPWISSPLIAYRFSAGFHVSGLVYFIGANGQFRLGSDWQISLLQEKPWALGVNVFAVAMIVLIKRAQKAKKKAAEPGATDNPDDAQRI